MERDESPRWWDQSGYGFEIKEDPFRGARRLVLKSNSVTLTLERRACGKVLLFWSRSDGSSGQKWIEDTDVWSGMWAARDRNSGIYDINFRREGDFLAFEDEDDKPFLSLKLTPEIRRASRFLIADVDEMAGLRSEHGYPLDNQIPFPGRNRTEPPSS